MNAKVVLRHEGQIATEGQAQNKIICHFRNSLQIRHCLVFWFWKSACRSNRVNFYAVVVLQALFCSSELKFIPDLGWIRGILSRRCHFTPVVKLAAGSTHYSSEILFVQWPSFFGTDGVCLCPGNASAVSRCRRGLFILLKLGSQLLGEGHLPISRTNLHCEKAEYFGNIHQISLVMWRLSAETKN